MKQEQTEPSKCDTHSPRQEKKGEACKQERGSLNSKTNKNNGANQNKWVLLISHMLILQIKHGRCFHTLFMMYLSTGTPGSYPSLCKEK